MTYGVVPPFEEFSAHLNTARDEDDEPVWDDSGYPMELVGSDAEQAKRALRKCDRKKDFRVTEFVGRPGKFALRFTDKKSLWYFIKALPIFTDDPDGDLASSIMTTLGYEWI
jgi:hypothetical protein